MVEVRSRVESNVSESDNCILCYNVIDFFAIGICDHKNTCHKCSLRLRLIMKDEKCSICKAELEEILISKNKSITWAEFEKRWRKKAIEDSEDSSILYDSK